jgi:2-polyprenyl-3-methyl-5-hydroxy-6-metoxy-1,4-benzoquinol methylase
VHGNTAIQREVAILNKLGTLERQVLDIGCGEGNFVRRIAGKLPEGLSYLAVDINPECREEVESLCKRKQLENVQIFASLDDAWTAKDKTDVLLVEVIEHMPMADAEALVKKVFDGKINTGKVLITTPNKSFNQFYDMKEDHIRHDDHHFELTEPEFREFLDRTVPPGYKVEIFWIGDVVNGIPTTLAAEIVQEVK